MMLFAMSCSTLAALPSRGAYLRWMLVAIMLAAIVLYRPQGLIRERSRVSDFMPKEDSRTD